MDKLTRSEIALGVSGALTGQGPVKLPLSHLGVTRGWASSPTGPLCVGPAGQSAGCRAFLQGQPFLNCLAGLMEIAFVTVDRDRGEGLRAVEMEIVAGRSQLSTVFFLSANLLYKVCNLSPRCLWFDRPSGRHAVLWFWHLSGHHNEPTRLPITNDGQSDFQREKAGSWFVVSGGAGTLKPSFRKGPSAPSQIGRFLAADSAASALCGEHVEQACPAFESSLLSGKLALGKNNCLCQAQRVSLSVAVVS